jgi:hypothetical protein
MTKAGEPAAGPLRGNTESKRRRANNFAISGALTIGCAELPGPDGVAGVGGAEELYRVS